MSLNEKTAAGKSRSAKDRKAALRQQKDLIQQLALELSGAEDRERQRLAGVLDDDLQQMLAYLKIQLTTECPHEVRPRKSRSLERPCR